MEIDPGVANKAPEPSCGHTEVSERGVDYWQDKYFEMVEKFEALATKVTRG